MPTSQSSDKPGTPAHEPAAAPPAGNATGNRRSGWRSLLTPGWALTVVLVVLFTYFAFSYLAPWQLGKNRDKNEFNQRLENALQVEPVPISDVVPADGASPGEDAEWTRVQLQGHFEPSKQVLLRNRPVDSAPAYQVLTPFAVTSGGTVLVNRGWVPSGDGAAQPAVPAPPSKDITVSGFLRMNEQQPPNPATEVKGTTQVTGINTQQIGQTQGTELATDYVQLDQPSVDKINAETSSPDKLNAYPLPHLDGGTNLSYGIQWIVFGILAPAGLGWFIYSELRERRRERQEIEEGQQATASGTGSTAAQPTATTEPFKAPEQDEKQVGRGVASGSTASQKLANRYGGTRNNPEERRARKKGQERF